MTGDVIENRTRDLQATRHAVEHSLDDLTQHGQDFPFVLYHSAKPPVLVDGRATARSAYVDRWIGKLELS